VRFKNPCFNAYAELVHDSIYKPSGDVPKSAERQIARSMALMETTDDLFCKTMEILADNSKERNKLLEFLSGYYSEKLASNTLMKIYMLTSPSLIPLKSTLTTICQIKSTCYSVRKYIPIRIINRVEYNPYSLNHAYCLYTG
jgi:hypothetical protein